MSDHRDRGLYRKFHVERLDESPRHEDCVYFVLDLDHDHYSLPALRAYADACREKFPDLSADLRLLVETFEQRAKEGEPT